MTKRICNKCGKEIEFYNDFSLGYRFGYESRHDGDTLNIDLCGACLDEEVEGMVERFKHSPLSIDALDD